MRGLALLFILMAPGMSVAKDHESLEVSADWNSMPLTRDEQQLLVRVQEKAIASAEQKMADNRKLIACLAQEDCKALGLSRAKLLEGLQEYNMAYRILVGHLNIASLRKGITSIAPAPGLPGFDLSDEERRLVFEEDAADRKVINERLGKNPNAPKTPWHVQAPEKTLYLAEGQTLYELQMKILMQQVPYLLWIKDEILSSHHTLQAVQKYQDTLAETASDLRQISDVKEFVFYESSFEEARGEFAPAVSAGLLAKAYEKMNFKGWAKKNFGSMISLGLYGCIMVATYANAWPLTVACGVAFVSYSVKNVVQSFLRSRMDAQLWIAGLKTFEQMQLAKADTAARVVLLSILVFSSGHLVADIVSTPFKKALAMTLPNLRSAVTLPQVFVERSKEFGQVFVSFVARKTGVNTASQTAFGEYQPVFAMKMQYGSQVIHVAKDKFYLTMASYLNGLDSLQQL